MVETTVDAKRTSGDSNGAPNHEFRGYEINMSLGKENKRKILTDITPHGSPVNHIRPPNDGVNELD